MSKSPARSSEAPPAWRFPDPEEEAFWREHLQRLDDPEKIEALCRREQERSNEAFHRGLSDGSFYESDKPLIAWPLERVRAWWAGELSRMPGATTAEREWARRVLSERWF